MSGYQRRVLLTGALCFLLFLAAGALLVALHAPDITLLVVLAVLYVGVARPLLAPARAAVRERRAAAFLAWREQRRNDNTNERQP